MTGTDTMTATPTLLLESCEQLPEVPLMPAPWHLSGRAYAIATWMPCHLIRHNSFLPVGLADSLRGRLTWTLFVDYRQADCGPYQELLYIPGTLLFGTQRRPSITRIFVSSYDSVVNGRRNWGIAKDRADFQASKTVDNVDQIRIAWRGQTFAELSLKSRWPALPFSSTWIPDALHTLMQRWQGQDYSYTPEIQGHVRPASVLASHFDARLFPDLNQGRILAAACIEDFQMRFPAARVQAAAD